MLDPGIAVVVLASVAGLVVGSTFTRAKLRSALISADRNLQSQLRISEAQLRENSRAEREKWLQARIEDSYSELGGWLWDLDLAIDGALTNAFSDDDKVVRDTLSEVNGWHWYQLRPPRSAAATQHYWSSGVHEKVNKIYEQSLPFVNAVKEVLNNPEAKDVAEEGAMFTPAQELWDRRFKLQAAISKVRKQMHSEICKMEDREA